MTTKTYPIEVEGLPEGWKAVAIKLKELEGSDSEHAIYIAKVIAEKIQPRRIVLEETEQDNKRSGLGFLSQQFSSGITIYDAHKIWREVKE